MIRTRGLGGALSIIVAFGCGSDGETTPSGNQNGGGSGGSGGAASMLVCPESEDELLKNWQCLLEPADAASPVCSYPGSGCPHVYTCVPIVNSPGPNGSWFGAWTKKAPSPGDACNEAGIVCTYEWGTCAASCGSGIAKYTCTADNEWALSFEEECNSCSCCDPCPEAVPMGGAPCNPSYATVLTCSYHDVETGSCTQAVCDQGSWLLEPRCGDA